MGEDLTTQAMSGTEGTLREAHDAARSIGRITVLEKLAEPIDTSRLDIYSSGRTTPANVNTEFDDD